MDQFNKKYHSGVLSFYIKLYCKRKSELNTKSNNTMRDAVKSWKSLNKSEKRLLFSKYKEYRSNINKDLAVHLKSTEPYLKSKVIKPDKRINKSHNADNQETDLEMCLNKSNSSKVEMEVHDMDNHIHDTQNNEYSNIYDFNHSTSNHDNTPLIMSPQLPRHEIIPIPEPTPPKIINAKELFLIIKDKEENNIQWEHLTKRQKNQYQKAVQSVKNKYLKEYIQYLEHLTSDKLFNYYRNIVNSI